MNRRIVTSTLLTVLTASACDNVDSAPPPSPEPGGRPRPASDEEPGGEPTTGAGDDASTSTSGEDATTGDVVFTSNVDDSGGGEDSEAPDLEAEPQPAIYTVGRAQKNTDGRLIEWPGGGWLVRFQGTHVSVTLTSLAMWTVVIDGVAQPEPLITKPGTHEYLIAGDLPPGEHIVELYNRGDGFGGSILVDLRLLGGVMLPPPPVERRIEVVGGGTDAGYGVLSEKCEDAFHAGADIYNSYGAIAARAFGAEVTTIAGTGWGLSEIAATYEQDSLNYWSPWEFPVELAPDAVVVHLDGKGGPIGTGNNIDLEGEALTSAYADFLGVLRTHHPDAALIVLAPDLNASADTPAVEAAVALRVAAGDANVTFHDINIEPTTADLGCADHLVLSGHQKMAANLIPVLGERLGWEVLP